MTTRHLYASALAALAFAAAQPAGAKGDSKASAQPESRKTVTSQRDTGVAPENLRELRLTVREVDPQSHKVLLEAQVTPEANITKNGQPIKIDQLKEGDEIRASFDPASGEVESISVTTTRPEQTQPETMPPEQKGTSQPEPAQPAEPSPQIPSPHPGQ